ncbi:YlaH-like family protein [Halalkalibacterium ligniniphilum]|uniref:YlaH-like family protein n=1 Tax=Halalkalibacterium ligniniphilum TaxID=1134413 RepID=UPI000346D153|nr:YlaH-like family protein [Halalkalibacterium ligniniphilum]
MENQELSSVDVENLSWIARGVVENPWFGFYTYLLMVALTILVFNLGFARKLPLLKSIIVYVVLVLGCLVFWTIEFVFPQSYITAILAITAVILGAYRFRLHQHRKKERQHES